VIECILPCVVKVGRGEGTGRREFGREMKSGRKRSEEKWWEGGKEVGGR
jgi:hypothetical protein